jgi:hypothetical protein
MAYAFPVEIGRSGVLDATATPMNRLQADSDAWHQAILGSAPSLDGIRQELGVIQTVLQSVPAMVVQMDITYRNVAVMSQSMGSTVGRMGSWLP